MLQVDDIFSVYVSVMNKPFWVNNASYYQMFDDFSSAAKNYVYISLYRSSIVFLCFGFFLGGGVVLFCFFVVCFLLLFFSRNAFYFFN